MLLFQRKRDVISSPPVSYPSTSCSPAGVLSREKIKKQTLYPYESSVITQTQLTHAIIIGGRTCNSHHQKVHRANKEHLAGN